MALGVATVAAHGAASTVWLRNPIAWAVGLLVATGLALRADRRWTIAVLLIAPASLAATLFDTGQAGVHRWLTIGPVSVNVAQVVLPAAVVALASGPLRGGRLAGAALIVVLLSLQPDASQALSFGVALLTIVLVRQHAWPLRLFTVAIVIIAVVASALQGDPLDPVAEVEGVIGLAFAISPGLAGAMWVAIAVSCLTLARPGRRTQEVAGFALAAYALTAFGVSLTGQYPIPLAGMAFSPVLGLWLGAGLLAAQTRLSTYIPAVSAASGPGSDP